MSSNKNTAKMTTTTTTKKTAAPKKEEAAAVVPAPVAAAAPKAAKVTKAAAAPVAVSTASAAVVAPVAVAAAAEPEAEVNLVAEFNAQVTKVNELRNTLGLVLADMKKLEKRLAREIKKAGRRRRSKAPQLDEAGNPLPKKPSVFTRPQKITDDLCVFLGKPKGTEMCRSDVTRGIMDYVKKHGLNNKQDINPDAALRKLLKSTEAEKVTILNLQRYLKNHYVKAPVAVVPA
jgi:chromatin remodeling complex protein RSC6